MENIPLLDLKGQYRQIKKEIDEAVLGVLGSGSYVLGKNVTGLEEEVAAYCDVKHGVGVASGTDALLLALIAMGVKEGDEIITTPYTFIATTEAVYKTGAKIVFADIDPDTFNIDVKQVEKKITKKTKVIIPVHLYGQSCDMDPLMELARGHGIKVLEDCAQAIGAEYKGKKIGSFGDAGCFSFFPSKNLGSYGEGGMVVTNDRELADKIRILRVHGSKERYYHDIDGFNSRLQEIQAAILRVKLRHLDAWTEKRRTNAFLYNELFSSAREKVVIPVEPEYNKHVYYLYTIKVEESRDKLQEYLKKNGIASCVYYPVPLHLQKVYGYLGNRKRDFPVSEKCAETVISLPIYPELLKEQISVITESVKLFCCK